MNAIIIARLYKVDDEHALQVVTASNFDKFDYTQDEAFKTQVKYANMGLDTAVFKHHVDGDHPLTVFTNRINSDQKVGDKVYPHRKIMKSHTWGEPKFGYL